MWPKLLVAPAIRGRGESYTQGFQDGVAWASDPNNRGQSPPLVFNPEYQAGFEAGVREMQGLSDSPAFFAATVLATWAAIVAGAGAVAAGTPPSWLSSGGRP